MIDLKEKWLLECREKNIKIECNIPCDNVSEMLKKGLIDDPYYGNNEETVEWISLVDWSLSQKFKITEKDLTEHNFLYLESLDTIADIFINGQFICRHENMFYPVFVDITNTLKTGKNLLNIEIKSPIRHAQKLAKKLDYPVPYNDYNKKTASNRNLIRKVQCHAGWDWGIDLPCSGIYGDCMIKRSSEGFIKYINTETKEISKKKWKLFLEIEYDALKKGNLAIDIIFNNKKHKLKFNIKKGYNLLKHEIEVKSPKLWWPAGYGKQPLYKLEVITDEETITKKIGFREIEAIYQDDKFGRSFYFRVNGVDIYSKGANWIPIDARPSLQTEDRYKELLSDALAANMNTIRLWGGGQYEKDCFYDFCDQNGLLVWHDLMFACCLYPSNEDFLENVKKEIEHQIKRLKNHPSIALWCGNNEILGVLNSFEESIKNRDIYIINYDRLNEGVIGKTVKRYDKNRTWWPSSPCAGPDDYSDCWHDDTKGDMHYWNVWHEGLPFESYYDVIPRFCSEFGFQSFPCIQTVKSFAEKNQLNLTSKVMRAHQKNNRGNTIILSTMAEYFKMPETFEGQLFFSQIQQAYAIRTAVEYWRSKRPVNMGALYWQLNDNWPVASWSSIDYFGRWKLLHYEAARFFKPVNIFAYIKNQEINICIVNDLLTDQKGKAEIYLKSFNGKKTKLISSKQESIQKQSSKQIFQMELPKDEIRENNFLYFVFTTQGKTHTNYLLLNRPLDCNFESPQIKLSRIEEKSYLLKTDKPAFYVTAETCKTGRFSDNGLLLLPENPTKIDFVSKGKDLLLPEIKEIKISFLN